jgi:hypothetical protein
MVENLERDLQQAGNDRQFGNWRVVVSAWALVLLFVVLLAGVSAVACLRGSAQPNRHLSGAVIPQHDPCSGPGVPSAPAIDGCRNIPFSQDRSAYW